MLWDSPFAYVVFMSGSGLAVAIIVHLVGWFFAPERIIPYFQNPD
jgi:hypothetical protein